MSDRHEKWVRVEPGHVIPPGQPHAIKVDSPTGYGLMWGEYTLREKVPVPTNDQWFVDSSWRPPLDLPIVPTWGIVTWSDSEMLHKLGKWRLVHGGQRLEPEGEPSSWLGVSVITDFIRLTYEQVARIEGAR